MKYIAKHQPSLVEPLFNGNTVTVNDPDLGYDVTTNKVNTLARIVKKQLEAGKLVIDDSEEIEFSVDGVIKTEAGKNWYYSTVNTLGIKDLGVRMLMVELANLKFKLEE
jgi:hypothetical protein